MFEERLKRIYEAIGVKTDTDLASALGIKPPSVAGAKKRSAVPGDWIEKVAKDYHVSADWLLFGRGPMRLGEQPIPQPEAAPPPCTSCTRCNILESENKSLREFKASQDETIKAQSETIKAQAETIRMYKLALESAQQEPFKGDHGMPAAPPSARIAPTSTELNK